MIYRLWNEAEKRYATAEELKYLRVNSEGVVERLVTNEYCDYVPCSSRECESQPRCDISWQPAPEWVVRWVCPECDGNGYYIVESSEQGKVEQQRCFSCYGTGYGELISQIIKTTNNTHDNSEMLEGK